MRPSWIEINLQTVRENLNEMRKAIRPGVKLLTVVKGDGYGHGVERVAEVLSAEGVDCFGVAFAEEGVELRKAGIKEPILIFGRTFTESHDLLFNYDLMPNIFDFAQAEELSREAESRGTRLGVHVSVDTGLHRLGAGWQKDGEEEILRICRLPGLKVEGAFSMFANSRVRNGHEGLDTEVTRAQYERFVALRENLKSKGAIIPLWHICDSAAVLLFPEMQMDMVRVGSALFGTYLTDLPVPEIQLKPAMSVHSKLASIRTIEAGEAVGYSGIWTAERPSVIGVVPFGSVDGMTSTMSGKCHVLLHGVRCPIVGEICMDLMMIDITDVENPNIGDDVVILGTQGAETITPQDLAKQAGLEDLEIICKLGKRSDIRYIE